MTLKNDAKFKEKLTCGFKYDMRHLVNFYPTTQKSEYFFSMGYFCPKYTRFELQKHRGAIFHDTEQWCKIWINVYLLVSKMAWGIGWTFIVVLKIMKKCTLMGSFCPKHKMFQLEKVIQNLKENWLVAWKMTQWIWLIFMWAVKSLKICTLMGWFCPKHTKV